jgi:transglutaminase-like putative cysteine protease
MDEGVFTAEDVLATGIVDMQRAAGLSDTPYRKVHWKRQMELEPSIDDSVYERFFLPVTYYNRQKVLSYKFSILPNDFYWHEDNSCMYAEYNITHVRGKTVVLEIEVEMIVYQYDLSVAQENHFPLQLTTDEKAFYTEETYFYQTSYPFIQQIAREAKGQTPLEIAKDLCRVVSNHLLENERIDSLATLEWLTNGSDDRWDFSVLYATLCRARGIPARKLIVENNFGERNTNHEIVEIYIDALGWVPVDPMCMASEGVAFENLPNGYYIYLCGNYEPRE